jgi:hypothetical protein
MFSPGCKKAIALAQRLVTLDSPIYKFQVLLKSADIIIDLGVQVKVASIAVVHTATFAHSISVGNVKIVIASSCLSSVAGLTAVQLLFFTKSPQIQKKSLI